MNKIKCLITDDEPLAIDVLADYIQNLDYLTLEGRCRNAVETINFLQKNKIDLLFLDIQMPLLSGIDLLRTMQHPPKVIFTTAYRDYALDGYDLNVLDYLLKPISFERFLVAINKFYEVKPFKEASANGVANVASTDESIYVKAQKKMTRIFLKDILYIESLRDYIRIKTISQEIVTHANISHLEEKLAMNNFLRVHRSFIVSLNKVDSFTTNTIFIGSIEIPIGRLYKSRAGMALQSGSYFCNK